MTNSDVVALAARLFHVDPALMRKDCRNRHVCRARFALYAGFMLRGELRGFPPSTSQIGRWCHRDHSTVIYGLRKAQALMETDANFMEAVCQIATATEESPCNIPLRPVVVVHQQPRRDPMDNPEYIEGRINDMLAKLGEKRIAVYWDGDVIERDTPRCFNVYWEGEDTPYWLEDYRGRISIHAEENRCRYTVDSAHYYEDIAAKLADFLPTAIIEEAA